MRGLVGGGGMSYIGHVLLSKLHQHTQSVDQHVHQCPSIFSYFLSAIGFDLVETWFACALLHSGEGSEWGSVASALFLVACPPPRWDAKQWWGAHSVIRYCSAWCTAWFKCGFAVAAARHAANLVVWFQHSNCGKALRELIIYNENKWALCLLGRWQFNGNVHCLACRV